MAQASGGAQAVTYQIQMQAVVVQATLLDYWSFPHAHLTLTRPQVISGGMLSTDQVVRLPRNAVVRSFPIEIQAGPAGWIRAVDVAEARMTDISHQGSEPQARRSVTLNFGGLRTVAGVGLASATNHAVIQVKQWTGAGFASQAVVSKTGSRRITPDMTTLTTFADQPVIEFPSEVRTERLQIDLEGEFGDATEAAESIRLLLPDLPADVQISIDGGAPAWRAPGPVRDGVEGWSSDGESSLLRQTVDLSQALTSLLADPTAALTDEIDLRISLAAREPGVLILGIPDPAALASTDLIRYLTVAQVDPSRREVVFEEEGFRSISLGLPDWADRFEGLRIKISGEFDAERVLPPLGPGYPRLPAPAPADTPRAEMILDPDRAAAVALGELEQQDGLAGVRLPLRAEAGDAEVRVLLLSDGEAGPGAAVPGVVTDPVTVQGGHHDAWYTFPFPEPVTLEPGKEPAVAIAVSRGRVAWALSEDDSARPVWHGPLEGPWNPLPVAGGLSGMGGRVRAVTTAGPEAPALAPVLAVLAPTTATETAPLMDGTAASATPEPEPAALTLTPASSIPPDQASVTFVSRAIGRLALDDAVAEVGIGTA